MANMNGNDSAIQNPEKNICDILKVIKNEEKTANSSHTAYITKRDSKEIARGYKICCLDKAEESHRVYQDLMSCIVLKNYKKTEIIQKNVDEYCKKDDELEKMINESSKMINELRVILASKGQNAFNSAVNVAGVQTFINTSGLKSFAAKLIETMKTFKDFIGENIKTIEKDVATFRDELNSIVEQLAEVTCALYSEGTKEKGLMATRKFICEDSCKDGPIDISCDCEKDDNCDDDHDGYEKMKKQTEDKD